MINLHSEKIYLYKFNLIISYKTFYNSEMLRQTKFVTSCLQNAAIATVKNIFHMLDCIYNGNRKVELIMLRSIISPWLWCFLKSLLNYARLMPNKSKITLKAI
jgi:hypothetical protein